MQAKTHADRKALLIEVAAVLNDLYDYRWGEDTADDRITAHSEHTSRMSMDEPYDGETVWVEIGHAAPVLGQPAEVVRVQTWTNDGWKDAPYFWVSPVPALIAGAVAL